MEHSTEYSQTNLSDEYSFETTEDIDHHHHHHTNDYTDTDIGHWQMFGQSPTRETHYRDVSTSDTLDDQTSFGFLQQQENIDLYDQNIPSEEIHSEMDYETIVRSRQLYYDPEPEIIRKPATIKPLVYNQNIKIRFLQPPPIPQGPLIIREVRPPQPPPPPPLIIRQRVPPPPSPSPIILRERPPSIPPIMGEQVITKVLPAIQPPPRSVIVERLPALPPKPRDIIIERWIPYESTQKRKVIVQRAEEPIAYPPPRNIVITYDPIPIRVIRQVERLDVKPENPLNYTSLYGNSLLAPEQLLTQLRELGIMEDLSPPQRYADVQLRQEQLSSSTIDEQNLDYITSSEQQEQFYDNKYAPTYENLINGSVASLNDEELNEQLMPKTDDLYSSGEDLSTQFAQYGITTDSIPY